MCPSSHKLLQVRLQLYFLELHGNAIMPLLNIIRHLLREYVTTHVSAAL